MYAGVLITRDEIISRCKESWLPLVLLQASWQWHIWLPASQPLPPVPPAECAHTRLVLDSLLSFSSYLGTCPNPCSHVHTHTHKHTHTEQSYFLFPPAFFSLPFHSIFTLPSLSPFSLPSPFSSLNCTMTTNELSCLYQQPFDLGRKPRKHILFHRLDYVLRLELKEKVSGFMEWHSGKRNTHIRCVLYPVGFT